MKDRIQALRRRLAELGCDGYVSLASPDNQYLTGFRGSTSAVIVSESHALFLCDFRYTEQAQTQVQDCTIEEITGNFHARTGERLKALGLNKVAFDPAYMTVAERLDIEKALGCQLKPESQLVAPLRMVKSAEEIQTIREASELAEGALAAIIESLEPGITEREVAARFEFEFKRRGASGASFDTIALFGARSSLPHGEPGDTTLEMGDTVLLDFGCRMHGYCSDLTRTYVYGTIPGAWLEAVYDLVLTAQRIALEAVRPGMRCRELDAVARNLIVEAGYGDHFGHGLGHGVGIEIHEAPRLNKESDFLLETGMVVTVEPGIYLPGQGGVRIEDLIVVTDDGCEMLSKSPKDLRVLGQ